MSKFIPNISQKDISAAVNLAFSGQAPKATEEIKGGHVKKTFRIELHDGREVIFSFYKASEKHRLERSLSASTFFRNHHIPTPKIISNGILDNGSQAHFLVQEFASGQHEFYPNTHKLRMLGDIVGSVHTTELDENSAKLFLPLKKSVSSATQEDIEASLPKGLIYNDTKPLNVFFSKDSDSVESLIDLDRVGQGAFLECIVRALICFCCDETSNELDLDKTKAFFRGYQKHRRLSTPEKLALIPIISDTVVQFYNSEIEVLHPHKLKDDPDNALNCTLEERAKNIPEQLSKINSVDIIGPTISKSTPRPHGR